MKVALTTKAALTTLTGLTAVLAAVAALLIGTPTAGASEEFYRPPSPLPTGRDGDVIKSEPATYNSSGAAKTTRVMYLSRDIKGRPMPVTGLVIVPSKPWTGPGPRPIVGYASATVGAGDQCALSKTATGEGESDLLAFQRGVFVDPLLAKGIAVAEVDYQGVGTPGDPTFTIRLPQAHAVLDGVRAAQRLPDTGLPPAGPVGITGYSQGGAASAAAAELAPSYAPELDMKGAYAGAVPTDLEGVGRKADGSYAGGVLALAVIGAQAAYPELDIEGSLSERGRQVVEAARSLCTMNMGLAHPFLRSSTLTADGRSLPDHLAEPPFNRIVDEQRIGRIAPRMPTLIEHPLTDDLVPYAQGRKLLKDWCAGGATVQFRDLPSMPFVVSHVSGTLFASGNSAEWLKDRFQGKPAESSC
ncbi:lipase family protein [Streptomyces boninensis]|uniref:lipase family protein n=1 Tax=Streptomyces boninensis TaxID=2039455 RepID=UPI003B21A220